MNAKEARLIRRRTGKPSPRMDKSEAKGYLAAIEGEEVSSLRSALETLLKWGLGRRQKKLVQEALAKYKQAVEGEEKRLRGE